VEQIRSRTSEYESEVWSSFSLTIESGEVHFGVPEIDDRRRITRERERETIRRACYMTISRLCEVIPFLRSLTSEFIVREVAIERRDADT